MKNIFKLFIACAFATLGFSACQQEEINYNEETATHTVTFIAESPETKTTVDISDGETAKFAWTDDDQDRFTAYENGTAATETVGILDDKTGKMTLMATFTGDAPASPKYQALYNSEVSATQSTVGSYAEVTDVMVSNVLDGPRKDNYLFSFKREVAFAKMTLKDLTSGTNVSSVTIESDKPIAGQYDLETGTFINTSNVITLDVLTEVADENATVWFTTIPVEDAKFTITAETINEDMTVAATYTKKFSKTITLTRGDVKGFGVTMTKDVVAAPEPVVLYCSDVTTGGYVTTATHVKNENLPFEYLQIMANGKNNPTGYGAGQVMQFRSSSGEIYNTESFGSPVKYVEVYAQSSNPFYVYYGDKKAPSENKISRPTTPSGTKTISIKDNDGKNVEEEVHYYLLDLSSYNANYIRIVNGSSTNYFYKIVLLFDEPETVQVTGIELDKTEVTINKGEKTTLTATITPSNATNKNLSWSSSAEGVATVENGVVTAIAEGNATITVTTEDGSHTATCDVTVTAAAAGGEASWTRVTTVNELIAGGTFIIGYEATAKSGKIVPMANTGSATTSAAGFIYSGSTATSGGKDTIDMSTVSETSNYEVTIVASSSVSGAICIKLGDNYLGNTNTSNNCKLFTTEAATTAFTPTVGSDDVFTLKIAANETYHTLQYNTGSPRFAVYKGAQKNVVIYKKGN